MFLLLEGLQSIYEFGSLNFSHQRFFSQGIFYPNVEQELSFDRKNMFSWSTLLDFSVSLLKKYTLAEKR